MNAPFIVAQAITTGQATQTPQIVKLSKPANGQAVSVQLDANTRLDFSGIASDQITLVRVGDQLVILFDNQATVTIPLFFGADGNPIDNLTIDLGSRTVDGQEFANLFPITTDRTILTATGGAGGGDGFGAGDPNVDPLNTGNPLDLLGNEDGPGITFTINEALARDNGEEGPIEPGPTAFSQTIGMDEDGDGFIPVANLPGSIPGGPGDDPTAPLSFFGGPGVSGNPGPHGPAFFSFGPDGPAATDPIVFDTAALDALNITSGGEFVTWTQFGNILEGRIGGLEEGQLVIRLTVLDLDTGDYRVDIYRALDHAAPSDGVAFENELPIPINFTLTDGNGTTANGTLTLSVDDDSPDPCNPVPGEVEEVGAPIQATVDLDLEWGADDWNPNVGSIDRKIEFASTIPGDNVVVRDVNGDLLPALTSNGETILYTIIGPATQGDPVYLVAYTELSPGIVPGKIDDPNVVFWASLSDQNFGDAVFELRGPIDHSAAPIEVSPGDYVHASDLTFSFNAFDADGDGVTGTFTIRVDAAGDVYVCGCGYVTIDYSALPGGVFINLADTDSTEGGQTVAANTATDLDGVSPKVIGRDNMDGIGHAIGTDSADVIIGGDEDNVLEGLGGADLIRGGDGEDWIEGGDGADTLRGQGGDDIIFGGAGADWIYGGRGDDLIAGQGGADTIYGGRGDDNIQAGAGDDWVQGGRGDDVINGEGGDDNLRGGRGDDDIFGGAGNDVIRGGGGDDYIEGNGGDDRIIYNVGQGDDVVFGGGGDDIQEIYGTADAETYNVNRINLGGDNFVGINIRDGIGLSDIVPATPGNFEVATRQVEDIYIDTGAGPDVVVVTGPLGGTGLATSTITIEGGSDNSTDIVDASLQTSDHSITFYGRGGDDAFALNTGKGTDTFDGGSGIDTAFFSCNVADATIAFDGTHWTVTVGGSTDTLIGVEGIAFFDQEYLLVDHAGQDVGGFQTIQEAVDYSCGCQTILIAPGTYDENVTITDLDISLMGLNPARDTIITGQITVTGVLDGDLTFSNLAIDATGEDYGVFADASSTAFGGEINLDNVLIENAEKNGFAYILEGNGSDPTETETIGAISIVNSEFSGNATTDGPARGDILIFGFNGDLTIADVVIGNPGAFADKAIQVRGIEDAATDTPGVGPYASFGDVSITDLTITGTYGQDLVAFYNIADFVSFVATNVSLNADAPWGLFNLDGVGGTVDLSGVTGTNGAGPFIATMQGLASGDVFTGTDGDDMFVGRGGDDNLSGGAGNDTFFYAVGGGQDIVDGGTETTRDLLDVTGTSADEQFFIETPAEYDARTGNTYAGAAEFLVSSDTQILTEVSEIEDIVIHGNGGADTLTVSGSFTGTSLLTSTITFDGTGDNNGDTVDASLLTSNHSIVFNGGGGNDTFRVGSGGGNHTFNAGAGNDTIDYSAYAPPASPTGVTVDLRVTTAQNTGNGLATLTGVENIVGSQRNDILTGNAGVNRIEGGTGDDLITGGGGDDTLVGGANDDTFQYLIGDGVDVIDGGSAFDFVGDRLYVTTSDNPDYIRISPALDADGNLDIDIDGNSLVENAADGIELDVTEVERVSLETEEGDDNVVISGDLAATGVTTIDVDLCDGNDNVVIAATSGASVNVNVIGDEGNDTVDASATAYAVFFQGGNGNDVFRSGAGDDTFFGQGNNDTMYYRVGDGRDVVDGGPETGIGGVDTLDVTGTGANENFFIEIPADYATRTGNTYGGTREILVSDDNGIMVEADEIEEIVVHGGGGGDTLTVSGSFTGTSLLTSTIIFDSGAGDDVLDLTKRDSNHRVVADGSTGADTVIYDFARTDVTSITKIFDTDGVTVIGANITHNTPDGPVTDVLKNFESFQFSDGALDLNTVFNQAPDAVNDTLSTLLQYDFTGTVSAKNGGVDWSSTYTFTVMVDASTRVPTSFGYEIPLVTSATLYLPYFSPNVIDIATPMRLGYNPDSNSNRVFLTATGPNREDAYTITLTEPQENIFLNQATFGPLTGTEGQFNFIGLRDIIGSALPPQVVFTGGSVTAAVAASNGVKTEDTPFIVAVSSLTGNDSDADGDPITFVSVQGAVGGTVSETGGYITFTPTADYFGPASFTYTIRDSAGLTDTATVSFNITNVNDAPVLDLDANDSTATGSGSSKTFTIGGAAVRIADSDVSITDADNDTIASAFIFIRNPQPGDQLAVSGLPSGFVASFAPGDTSGVISFNTGSPRSRAEFEAALEAVTFSTTGSSTTQRVIEVQVSDPSGGTAISTASITVNPEPVDAVNDTLQPLAEDVVLNVAVSTLTGNDSGPFTFASVQGAVNGTVTWNGGSVITFTPTANYFGPASFTYTIQGSSGQTDTATASFNITNVNDGPQIDLDSTTAGVGSTTIATPFGPAVRVTSADVSIIDSDDANMSRAILGITNQQAGDTLGLAGPLPGGITATFDANGQGVELTGLASRADYEAAIEAITFSTTNTDTTARNIAISIYDAAGTGGGSVAQVTINSNPTIASPTDATGDVTEDAGTGPNGPNLVVNGGFESYVIGSFVNNTLSTLTGWNFQNSIRVEPSGAVDGFVSLELRQLGSTIWQNITTVAGQLYELQYWQDGNFLRVSFNGAVVLNVSDPSDGTFGLYSVQFVGTGGPAELRFTSVNQNLGSQLIDGVSVQLISPPAQQTDSGTITFADVNGGDTHSASFAAQGGGYVGSFSLGGVNQAGDNVGWTFSADNSALQFLSANQTVTQYYDVTVTDQLGGRATQTVAVQLHGENDPVVITTNNGNLLQLSVMDEQTAVTTIAASDVDLNDTLSWSLSGTDAGFFDISNAGVITFKNAPDYNLPFDAGGNNVYDLIVNVTDGTVTDTQAVEVTVTDGPFPSGTDKAIAITEDVLYTFTLADFGFSDTNGDAFAGVTLNYAVNTLPGHLLFGNFELSPGDFVTAAAIEAGMLTFTPQNNEHNVSAAFTFSVQDTGPSGLNTDPTPNTMTLNLTGDQTDIAPFSPTNFNLTFVPSEFEGYQSFMDPFITFSADFDRFQWTQSGVFTNLEMTRSLENLQITFTTDTGSGVFTILNQYTPGSLSAIEEMQFTQQMDLGPSVLAGPYNLSAGNGGNGNDIVVGGPGFDTLRGGDFQDVLFGAGGPDTLLGEGGNDILVGGLGNDTLVGGDGMDTYRFTETGSAHRDTVVDYDRGAGEQLDLSALLDANFGSGSNVADFVRVQSTGADAVVQVDTNGAAGGANWQDVAVLTGYGNVGNTVLTHFEQQTQVLQVA